MNRIIVKNVKELTNYYFEFVDEKGIFKNSDKKVINIYNENNILLHKLRFSEDEYELFGTVLLLIYYEVDKIDDENFINNSTIFEDTTDEIIELEQKVKPNYYSDYDMALSLLEEAVYNYSNYSFNLVANSSDMDSYYIDLSFFGDPIVLRISHLDKNGCEIFATNMVIGINDIFIISDIILGLTE